MSWNRRPLGVPAPPSSSELCLPDDGGSREADGVDAVTLLPVVTASDEHQTGCWHVRPLPVITDRVPPPVQQRSTPETGRPPGRPDLRSIGLPEHLVPADGGIFRLLSLFERLPRARIPALRAGDDVAVITVRPPGNGSPSCSGWTELISEITECLRAGGRGSPSVTVHVMVWPDAAEHDRPGSAESALVEEVRALRARLELIVVHPDCPGAIAYPACRALPGAQLYLRDVQRADRPAAPLGWGSPVAYVDGRPASPAVLAAVFADRLAGGVT